MFQIAQQSSSLEECFKVQQKYLNGFFDKISSNQEPILSTIKGSRLIFYQSKILVADGSTIKRVIHLIVSYGAMQHSYTVSVLLSPWPIANWSSKLKARGVNAGLL